MKSFGFIFGVVTARDALYYRINLVQRLAPTEPGRQFGKALAAGSTLVVGATGVAYCYNESWALQHTLRGNGLFGASVALDDFIVVGGDGVFLFKENVSELVPSGMNVVAAARDTVVVGAFADSSVFIFDKGAVMTLNATRGTFYGRAVALDDDVFVVGASFEGACYVYSRDGTLMQRLVANVSSTAQFGQAVAVSDSFIFVSAWVDRSGSVFVFTKDGMLSQKLVAQDALFGVQVAVANHLLVVGASDSAYVYALEDTTWNLVQRLAPPGASSFGTSLAVKSDGLFAIGAPLTEDVDGVKSGAVYVYQLLNCAQIFLRSSGNETVRYTFTSTTSVFSRTLTPEESQEVCLADGCYNVNVDSDSSDIAWTYATVSGTTNTPTQLALRNGQVFPTCDDSSSKTKAKKGMQLVLAFIACVGALCCLAACYIARRHHSFKPVSAAHVPATTEISPITQSAV